jgi:hypothetical protein
MTASRFMKRESQKRETKFRSGLSVNPVEYAGSRPAFMVSSGKKRKKSLGHYEQETASPSIGQWPGLSPVPYGVSQ